MCARRRVLLMLAAMPAWFVGCAKPAAETEPTSTTPTATPADVVPNPVDPTKTATSGGKSVLFISNANSPFWDAVEVGIKKGAEETGVQGALQRNVDGTVDGQIRLLEQALTRKDELLGVAVSAIRPDAPGLLDAMRKLKGAGVPVITVDSDCAKDARAAFVANNLLAGELLGQTVAKLVPAGATFCAFVGDTSAQNAVERLKGFQQGAGDKFKLAEQYQDGVEPAKARSNVETALTAHPEATMMLGLWSYNGPNIADAVAAAGKADSVKVVCFDAEPALLPLLEKGAIVATCVQRPYEFGRVGMNLLVALSKQDQTQIDALLKGGDVIETGIDIVTPETYPAFKQGLDAKGLKSS
jgi:ribose transport system substrate-binding protein